MRRLLLVFLPLLLAASPAGDEQVLRDIRALDLRLGTIAHRLVTANAALCAEQQPGLGVTIQAIDQYAPAMRPAARAVLGFDGAVGVEGVVAGGPAARAGVAAGDTILMIDGVGVPQAVSSDEPTSGTRDAAEARLALLPPAAPVRLAVSRGGVRREVAVKPEPACRSRFELMLGRDWTSSADGQIVQIGRRFLDEFGDDATAVVTAHELAHNILRHRARLNAAGVKRGAASEFGRNGRLFRTTEEEADRLSVSLLYNAGYDPLLAARFWRGDGDRIDGGLFRARTHYGPNTRAKQIEAEAALIPPGAPRPYVPAILAARDKPF